MDDTKDKKVNTRLHILDLEQPWQSGDDERVATFDLIVSATIRGIAQNFSRRLNTFTRS